VSGPPATRYAKSGDLHIAYQVLGEGPDLVFVPGFVSNVESVWDLAPPAAFFTRLASFSRLILFDKRGTGLSDRVPVQDLPSLEERMDDVRAVMDAVGSSRASLLGLSEGGPMSILFAATYPSRVERLILYGSYARRSTAEPDHGASLIKMIEATWGTGAVLGGRSGGALDDPAVQQQLGRFERQCATPGAAAAVIRMAAVIDVRPILEVVKVPTLVLHRTEDPNLHIDGARELAAGVPGARLVELDGQEHLPWAGDDEPIIEEIEEFVTGSRHALVADRVLATVLFTDIVGSTTRASELGDADWRALLERHREIVRAELARWRGREVVTTGDGFLATFDGPARAIRCARAILDAVEPLDVELRIGLHTGEIELMGDDVGGIGVHIGARVGALAAPGEVLVSRTVVDLVAGSGIDFDERGEHELRGVPGRWQLYAVTG
jgi:class 3 adenylate cyclase